MTKYVVRAFGVMAEGWTCEFSVPCMDKETAEMVMKTMDGKYRDIVLLELNEDGEHLPFV